MLPLGKGDGKSLTVLLQCQLPHVLYTGLEDYKQCASTQILFLMHCVQKTAWPKPCSFCHLVRTRAICACRLGASAPPVLTVTHYTELQESHGIVLARGDVVSPHVVSVPEVRSW